MSQIIPIYIPTYISDQNYNPARVLPRLLFYNGMIDCQPWYFESGSTTVGGTAFEQTAFPYFDNYNVVTGSFPTTDSDSLLFFNEQAVYGETPTDSLYTNYWETYVELLYNPRTRLLNASAIIPLADYFKMELNDIVEFRGNYYHLRFINDYNLKNGECQIQLLGPILSDASPAASKTTTTTLAPECIYDGASVECGPFSLPVEYLVVAGGGGGGGSSNFPVAGGGGGGAGGLLSGSLVLERETYSVTVGSGGGSQSNGAPSSISGSVIGLIQSTGGGAGASGNGGSPGAGNGGSGGGASACGQLICNTPGTANSGAQGSNGGSGNGYSSQCGAGVGGASAAGSDAAAGNTPSTVRSGGAGRSSSISGTATFYAGGGGGGGQAVSFPRQFGGNGGAGGGGKGGGTSSACGAAVAGTANTGGGGGGACRSSGDGANGGSGVVIIRYAGTQVATGGTVTQVGGYTIHTFTAGGTFQIFMNPITTTTTSTTTSTTTTTSTSTTTSTTTTTTCAPVCRANVLVRMQGNNGRVIWTNCCGGTSSSNVIPVGSTYTITVCAVDGSWSATGGAYLDTISNGAIC